MTTCSRSAVSILTDFFASDAIEATARRTGFVKRTSKLTGKLFLALITFGAWSDATTTLAQLAAKVTQWDEGSVSNVDIDRNNTLQVKAIGVAISTFETLPEFLYRVSWCGDCSRNGENITRAHIVVFARVLHP